MASINVALILIGIIYNIIIYRKHVSWQFIYTILPYVDLVILSWLILCDIISHYGIVETESDNIKSITKCLYQVILLSERIANAKLIFGSAFIKLLLHGFLIGYFLPFKTGLDYFPMAIVGIQYIASRDFFS